MLVNNINLTEEEAQAFEDYIITNQSLSVLEKKKKVATENIKTIFEKYNIQDAFDYNGSTFTVTETSKITISAKDKNPLIQYLSSIGRQYLCVPNIDIDTATLKEELEADPPVLSDEEIAKIKSFASLSHPKTLRCK